MFFAVGKFKVVVVKTSAFMETANLRNKFVMFKNRAYLNLSFPVRIILNRRSLFSHLFRILNLFYKMNNKRYVFKILMLYLSQKNVGNLKTKIIKRSKKFKIDTKSRCNLIYFNLKKSYLASKVYDSLIENGFYINPVEENNSQIVICLRKDVEFGEIKIIPDIIYSVLSDKFEV